MKRTAVRSDPGIGRVGPTGSSPGSSPRWVTECVFAVLVATAGLLVLSPVLRRSGWPFNQGSTAPLLLVQIYAAHFHHLDFFPVWSSSDAYGMGSPVLLYYHRTFFYVAGLLMAVGDLSLKASVVTTIAMFLFVGAYGMRQALRVVTDNVLLCTVGSLGFLFPNYTFTDWLFPRGDLAEFSAVMVVPWLLYWCLMLVKERRFSFLLIPIMVLLVNTHSAIALTSLFALAVALITFLWHVGWGGLKAVLPRLGICVAAIVVLVAPLLIAAFKLGRNYDPATKNTSAGYHVPGNSSASAPTSSRAAISGSGSVANSCSSTTPSGFRSPSPWWAPSSTGRPRGEARHGGRRPGRRRHHVLVFLGGSLAVYLFPN